MPVYRYQALDSKGARRNGVIEAMSPDEAKERLRSQDLMVTQINEKKGLASRENLRGEELVAFTLQLAQLINAGLPLYESIIAMEAQYRGEPCHRVVMSLGNQIKSGTPLSKAMGMYPQSFSRLYCAMVSAGEAVGALGDVLERLGELLSKQIALKNQISTAMIYPSILATFCLLIIAMLLGFVVPSIEGIFKGRELNAFTAAILSLSTFARGYWMYYIPGIIASITLIVWRLRSDAGKLWLQRTAIKLPYLRTLVIQASTARFCRTMGTLQQGGLPMIDSLRIARATIGNYVIEKVITDAEEAILSGSTLAKELSKSELIPSMASRMLLVGEEAGTSVVMMNRIAEMYEGELEQSLTRLISFAQPVILIVMGGIIGMVMVAILLPIANVASVARG
jgi:general secretion pathway protein F/type IV pilus assembly protein PilC